MVLVHSSFRAIGGVAGGAAAVVAALLDVIGAGGTLVVPAQTAGNRDPSRWRPRVDPSEWPRLRRLMPPFDPITSPSQNVGVIAETVRTWTSAVRSSHPQVSFAAIGRHAPDLMAEHALESPLGERSPLARMVEAGAMILLLGVGFNRCTAFHLAEYRLPGPPLMTNGCMIQQDARPIWVRYRSVALDASDFGDLGADLESTTTLVHPGLVGEARCRLLPMAPAVAFAEDWFLRRRGRPAI